MHHCNCTADTLSLLKSSAVVQTYCLPGSMEQCIDERNDQWSMMNSIINYIHFKNSENCHQNDFSVSNRESITNKKWDVTWHFSKLWILENQMYEQCRSGFLSHVWRDGCVVPEHECMVSPFGQEILKCFEKFQMRIFFVLEIEGRLQTCW